jgi:hypothetical protein
MNEFFSLLCKELRLKGNKIPKSSYEANKLIKSLGLLAMICPTPMKKDVCFFEVDQSSCKCVQNLGLLGLWKGQNLFHGRSFDTSH